MQIIVISIHILAAIILVLTVLLQAGKGAGMGAAFGGASGTVFGTRGPATLISKITCVAAVVFMCTSLNLALNAGGASKSSVMDSWSDTQRNVPAAASAPEGAMATPAPPTAVEPASPESAAVNSESSESNAVEDVAAAGSGEAEAGASAAVPEEGDKAD